MENVILNNIYSKEQENMEITILVLFILFTLIAGGVLIFFVLHKPISLEPYKTKNPEKNKNIRRTKDTELWAEANNFEFLGFYNIYFGCRSFMAVWKSKEKPTHLIQYILSTGSETLIAKEFTTIFENRISLDTSNTRDSILYPRPPGCYHQSFLRCGYDELYRIHLETEEYLIAKGGTHLAKSPINFEKDFVDYLKRENRRQWKHWYWIIFILYFYFVRRYKWHNKTVKQQHELGMVQLPNEILLKQFNE